jgi:hypothetical protein
MAALVASMRRTGKARAGALRMNRLDGGMAQ